MAHEFVTVERDGHVVTVTLDRPGTRNACSMSMWLAIRDTFREIAASDARVVVLTGANGDFCSGADVVSSSGGEGFDGSHLTAMRQLAESVMAVHDCPVPVIVKVDGVSVGAGFGLALARRLADDGWRLVLDARGAEDLHAAARDVPEHLLLVETDSPYLAPVPLRGKPNEPANVQLTAEFVAELRGVGYGELDAAVERNSARVFGW